MIPLCSLLDAVLAFYGLAMGVIIVVLAMLALFTWRTI